jgi:hypothetical protein
MQTINFKKVPQNTHTLSYYATPEYWEGDLGQASPILDLDTTLRPVSCFTDAMYLGHEEPIKQEAGWAPKAGLEVTMEKSCFWQVSTPGQLSCALILYYVCYRS